MKLITKTKILVLIIISLLFTFSPIITNWLKFNAENGEKSSENNDVINTDNKNLYISKISGKIHIDNNWSAAKSEGICTGHGTFSDPYVIKNLIIDGEGSGSCILIENSLVHFKIENCTLYNAGNYSAEDFSAGIYLSDVSNAQIIDNNCSSNCIGIYLNWSNSNAITENIVTNNICGICLTECDNNIISGNTIKNNAYGGISSSLINYNTIFGNCIFNNMYGIYSHVDYYNNISGNVIFNNSQHGILITSGGHNSISENTVNNNTFDGIYLEYSYYNEISGNDVFNNKIGMFFGSRLGLGCQDNRVTENIVKNNRKYGIGFDSWATSNDVYRNSFNNSLNAYDNGSNNWDNGFVGNYWSDYTGVDEDGDGIGDTPYSINGMARSKDNYPLMKCPIPVQKSPFETLILITIISGGAVIGVATILLIIRKRKRI